MVKFHQSSIVRHFGTQGPLQRLGHLYRTLEAQTYCTFDMLLSLSHRYYVVKHLATFFAKRCLFWFVDKGEQASQMSTNEQILTKCVTPYLWMLFHFLEKYREGLIEVAMEPKLPLELTTVICRQLSANIIRGYNKNLALRLPVVFQHLLKMARRILRPPSYAGTVERAMRGWTAEPASERQCLELLIKGGLENLRILVSIKVYNNRIEAINSFLRSDSFSRLGNPFDIPSAQRSFGWTLNRRSSLRSSHASEPSFSNEDKERQLTVLIHSLGGELLLVEPNVEIPRDSSFLLTPNLDHYASLTADADLPIHKLE